MGGFLLLHYLNSTMTNTIRNNYFYQINRTVPCSDTVIHIFDVDDTLTIKPEGFDNSHLSKEEFFDASRNFGADYDILRLLKLLRSCGDAIAVCTSRPVQRLRQTYSWLNHHQVPFDVLMASTNLSASNATKQLMILSLQQQFKSVGTFVDDSPWNCMGAALHGVRTIHVRKNCKYWDANPEKVVKVQSEPALITF